MLIPNRLPANDCTKAEFVEITAAVPLEQTWILPRLHKAICDGGGWVLHRMYTRPWMARMVFEFPRDTCVDVYGSLVSLGFELSPSSHLVMADLCHCTPYLFDFSSRSLAVKDNASLDQATVYICSLEFVKVELSVSFVAQAEFDENGFYRENTA